MTKLEAIDYVESHGDSDDLDRADLEAAYLALTGQVSTDDDYDSDLWSHLVNAVDA